MGKQIQLIKYPATQVAACDVPGAKFEVDTSVSLIDYLTVSDTTSEVVLTSTLPHRMVRSLRKRGGLATIFKALKF